MFLRGAIQHYKKKRLGGVLETHRGGVKSFKHIFRTVIRFRGQTITGDHSKQDLRNTQKPTRYIFYPFLQTILGPIYYGSP